MSYLPCSSPQYWIDQWNEARHYSLPVQRKRKVGNNHIQKDEQSQSNFFRPQNNDKERQYRQRVLEWLEAAGALGPTIKVLDTEAGVGTYTIPFAQYGALVTAVEPHCEKALILKQRAIDQSLHTINVMTNSWQDISLRKLGFADTFDLVFSSLNNSVQNPGEIERMIQASRKYCFISALSGPVWTQPQIELWELLFQETLQGNPQDIMYSFGLLYAMGYRPELRFDQHTWTCEESVETAVEDLCSFFDNYVEINEEINEIIEDYVRIRSPYGIFVHQARICRGMMLWRVDQRIE